jgi:hypothetical protein
VANVSHPVCSSFCPLPISPHSSTFVKITTDLSDSASTRAIEGVFFFQLLKILCLLLVKFVNISYFVFCYAMLVSLNSIQHSSVIV